MLTFKGISGVLEVPFDIRTLEAPILAGISPVKSLGSLAHQFRQLGRSRTTCDDNVVKAGYACFLLEDRVDF